MRAAGFWSLLDVIRVYAQSYVHLGRVFQYWMDRSESEKVSREDRQNLTQALRDVVGCCKSLGLTTSEELIRQANTDFFSAEKLELDYFSVSQKIGEFERCVTAELKSRFFFFIPSERARYLVLVDEYIPDDEVHVGAEVQRFAQIIDKFKGVTSDIVDAGNCFATGAYTACVYHLMRTCEYGLVSLAEDLGVDPGFGSWEKLLSRISNKIGQLDKKHPEGWKERRDFYSEAATLMQNVKNSWRNSVSHVRKTYDEPRARRIFNTVEALMQHLATRLGRPAEKVLPPVTLLQDPDAEVSSDAVLSGQ